MENQTISSLIYDYWTKPRSEWKVGDTIALGLLGLLLTGGVLAGVGDEIKLLGSYGREIGDAILLGATALSIASIANS